LITLSTCSATTNFDTQISVYSGACGGLTCVASNDNDASCGSFFGRLSKVSFTSTAGTVYRIMVTGKLSASGTFTLAATCAIVNDDCSNPTLVTCGSTTTGTTVGASTESPGTCGTTLSDAAPGLWYRVVGNGGMITASLCGSAFDTKIGVFTGTCGALTCVTGNDDSDECGDFSLQSQVVFPSTAGTSYLILVKGFLSNAGNFTLTVTCGAPPTGACDCSNDTEFLTVTAPSTPTPLAISTCTYAGEYNTINSAVSGSTYVVTSSIATDHLTVRQGTPGGAVLACGPTPLTVTATANGPIYLHVNTNSACGTESLCRGTTITCTSCAAPVAPANNECAAATTLTPGATCVTTAGTTTAATQSIPAITCAGFTSDDAFDVWYKFTATQATHAVVVDATFDAVIDVRSGACTGTNIACADDNFLAGVESVVLNGLTVGQTYLIRVYEWGGDEDGPFTICVTNGVTSLVDGSNGVATLAQNPEHLEVGNIYPNPAQFGQAFLDIATPEEAVASIQLFDQAGRMVRNMETELYSGVNKVELNVNNLAQGTYFAAVRVNNEVFRKKLIVVQP